MPTEKSINQLPEVAGASTNERSQDVPVLSKPETSLEQPRINSEKSFGEGRSTTEKTVSTPKASATTLPPIVDPQIEARRLQIESVMAQNLAEVYQGLTKEQQIVFKTVGEKTAQQINLLLSETKVRVNKIINLIKSWLNILPGINKFFLEKEAKIKTDAIIQLKKGGEQ